MKRDAAPGRSTDGTGSRGNGQVEHPANANGQPSVFVASVELGVHIRADRPKTIHRPTREAA